MLSRAYVQRPGCNHSKWSKTTSLRGTGTATSNTPEKGATTTAIANASGSDTFQSAACSGQHGKQSSQPTATCFHFFIEENIDEAKSTGCLLWGSSGCRLCRRRLSTQQNAIDWNGIGKSPACSGQHDDNHNRHPADFTLSVFSSTKGIAQYQYLNI